MMVEKDRKQFWFIGYYPVIDKPVIHKNRACCFTLRARNSYSKCKTRRDLNSSTGVKSPGNLFTPKFLKRPFPLIRKLSAYIQHRFRWMDSGNRVKDDFKHVMPWKELETYSNYYIDWIGARTSILGNHLFTIYLLRKSPNPILLYDIKL